VLYEFVGSKPVLTQEEVNDTILKADIPYSQVAQVVDHLCALAFLGVEIGTDEYRFAEDFQSRLPKGTGAQEETFRNYGSKFTI